MNCPFCGEIISDNDKFCRFCGSKLDAPSSDIPTEAQSESTDYSAPNEVTLDSYDINMSSTDNSTFEFSQVAENHPPQKMLGMRWYNFIVKIQLWLFMLAALSYSGQFFSGHIYGEYTSVIYERFPIARIVDNCFGVLMLLLIVFAFITRRKLIQFEWTGVIYFLSLPILSILLTNLYPFVVCLMLNGSVKDFVNFTFLIERLIFTAVYIALNNIYFRKRKQLFSANHLMFSSMGL